MLWLCQRLPGLKNPQVQQTSRNILLGELDGNSFPRLALCRCFTVLGWLEHYGLCHYAHFDAILLISASWLQPSDADPRKHR